MADGEMVVAPAGWFADPTGLDLNRWWNGSEWTEHTSPKPSVDPVVDVVQRQETPASGYVPFGGQTWGSGAVSAYAAPPVPSRWTTGSAVALGFLPWISLLALAAMVFELGVGVRAWYTLAATALLPTLLSWAFAARDRRALGRWGYDPRASAFWILLGPLVYLIVRTVRVRSQARRGAAPLVMLIINSVVITAALVGGGVAAIPLIDSSLATRVESEIDAQSAARGIESTTTCDGPAIDLFTATGYPCEVTLKTGQKAVVIVKIVDGKIQTTLAPGTGN